MPSRKKRIRYGFGMLSRLAFSFARSCGSFGSLPQSCAPCGGKDILTGFGHYRFLVPLAVLVEDFLRPPPLANGAAFLPPKALLLPFPAISFLSPNRMDHVVVVILCFIVNVLCALPSVVTNPHPMGTLCRFLHRNRFIMVKMEMHSISSPFLFPAKAGGFLCDESSSTRMRILALQLG